MVGAALKKVLVTRKLPEVVEERLAASYDVTLNAVDVPLTAAELADAMGRFDAIVPTVSDTIGSEILRVPNRQVAMLANVGVGFSNIDIDTARELGVTVSNTPDVLTDATADIAMLLILASTRGSTAAERKLRDGRWEGFSIVGDLGTGIQGKVLGIVGMGRIGQATARRAVLAFGMEVVFFNRSEVTGLDFDATQLDSLDELMAAADVVSVHVPGGSDAPVVDAQQIGLMKPTAHLVNTARGDSIDQEALITALQTNKIAGAGLDVFVDEPQVPDSLRALDNVTLLPHVGSATEEVRTAMGMLAADNLDAFFAGTQLPSPV